MKVTKIFSQSQTTEREARTDDHPAVLEEPVDHAVTGGRDESLHCEGGHSSENHTVAIGDHRRAAEATNLSDRHHRSRTRCCKTTLPWFETNHGVVTYHKVTLKKKHRRNHRQRASGERETQKEPQPTSQW